MVFDYTHSPTKITALEPLIGSSGWLTVQHLEIDSFEYEDYLITACITEQGTIIESDTAQRLFSLEASEHQAVEIPIDIDSTLKDVNAVETQRIISANAERNNAFFDTEMDKLDQWADDMKLSLDKEIKDLDAEIKLRKSEAKKMLQLEAKVKAQREIKEMEKKRREKRQHLYEAQDIIDERKENLLVEIEQRLKQQVVNTELFTIKWKMT